jgi:hypothetical protein
MTTTQDTGARALDLLRRVADYWAGGDVPPDLDAEIRDLLDSDTFRVGTWAVRIVRKGGRYGLNDCLTHSGGDPLVEFYDTRQDKAKFGPMGQFVQRYRAPTIVAHPPGFGLNLYAGVPGWQIGWEHLSPVVAWIESRLIEGSKA